MSYYDPREEQREQSAAVAGICFLAIAVIVAVSALAQAIH